ncbi:SRPBCC family protein [Hoyosella sp. G463]|uniref:SRPBCC family protein n=1 Tax=Lolliginicoccus lacisalsi TaxID=2742202 RepID=A0A927JD74_9ACTN|nr:SRPBCC family protein [Lolliginicoccus lacisalsi]MBD8507010.1 SRPBCC family protein [Lolliginicoccus lacisalsi]
METTRQWSVSRSTTVQAPPELAYSLISDPTRTGEWSPENTGASLRARGSGPLREGDEFDGTNKRGPFRWITRCTVTHAVAGQRFRFKVRRWGVGLPLLRVPVATWDFELEATDGGTRITETWTDDRRAWPDSLCRIVDPMLTGKDSFAEFNARNIEISLARMKKRLEDGGRDR